MKDFLNRFHKLKKDTLSCLAGKLIYISCWGNNQTHDIMILSRIKERNQTRQDKNKNKKRGRPKRIKPIVSGHNYDEHDMDIISYLVKYAEPASSDEENDN